MPDWWNFGRHTRLRSGRLTAMQVRCLYPVQHRHELGHHVQVIVQVHTSVVQQRDTAVLKTATVNDTPQVQLLPGVQIFSTKFEKWLKFE